MTQKGFYFHYKRDPSGDFNNYAYEVIGIGLDTESGKESVIYRPLYRNEHLGNNDWYIRPIEMFDELIEAHSKSVKRFELVTDVEIISKLKTIRNQMYK